MKQLCYNNRLMGVDAVKKRILLLTMLWLAALLLTGCAMRTVEEMYALPKRPEEYKELQSAIDTAMYGLTYSAPQSGDHQQSVQMADLDGDGVEEYLVFAKGATEKPLEVLIFSQDAQGKVQVLATIGFNGLAFEQVEYVEFDDNPGCELIVGIQVGDQVLRSVAVYSFASGDAELVLLNSYSKFIACDLDADGHKELMVLRPGEAETERGIAVLYSFREGQIERSVETELSVDPSRIRRITQSCLEGGIPAVYVSSSTEENSIVTDIFTLKDGGLANVSIASDVNTSIDTLRNYYVYADDLDDDGVLELPSMITMKPVSGWEDRDLKYLLRWFSVNENGWEIDKLFTFHDYVSGWYLELDGSWASRASVDQGNNTYTFYVWNESYQEATPLFTVFILTGSDRDEEAGQDGRFALYRAEGVAYAGRLEADAAEYKITEKTLVDNFHLIHQNFRASG